MPPANDPRPDDRRPGVLHGHRVVLVLAGGNALGAYQGGVYQALHEHGIDPDWIVGTSIGAVNGAIIAGNAPDDRLPRLRDFWRPGDGGAFVPSWRSGTIDTWRRSGEALATLIGGRAGMFAPVGTALPRGDAPALYDTTPLAGMLARLVDFDRLNTGSIRYTTLAVALDSGADAVFDTRDRRIGGDHIRASGAMPPAFPPIAIDGALFVDGGLSANLPLDPVLASPGPQPVLCIAIDLLPLAGPRSATIGSMIARSQDLAFAAQSRRAIERWRERYAIDPPGGDPAVALVQLTYADQQREVAGKSMDFSPESVRERWTAGYRDGGTLVARLHDGTIALGQSGLTVTTMAAGHD